MIRVVSRSNFPADGIHGRVLVDGYVRDCVLMTSLMELYSLCGLYDDAYEVFDDMPQRENVGGIMRTYDLCVKGIRKLDSEFDDDNTCPKSYECRVRLMSILKYKADMIKAEMVNGVFKVTIPKVKIEERMDIELVPAN
ncbi:small heat shock protein, chloroplastic-like [Spinacia oleracea]|uniref:Small heat shock protein, chloroplastic-like n=1 Tax=Spinacia oleracea TaxID=3562 RepID=A0ABM3RRZ7_SPIOL|nr:small heat shock protein, chloroplastic-like [Spinacia oleracea]